MKKKDHEIDLENEEEAYKDLIAGSSSDENDELSENENASGDENEAAQKRIEEMRMKLLGGITAGGEDRQRSRRDANLDESDDDDISDGAKEELQVNFGVGFGEDIGKKLI